jgi:hypothetical protein
LAQVTEIHSTVNSTVTPLLAYRARQVVLRMARIGMNFLILSFFSRAAGSTNAEHMSLLQTRARVMSSDATELDLRTVMQNNLGGFGPDSGAAEVRYGRVATLADGKDVDLVVHAVRDAAHRQGGNGNKNNEFGKLTQASGTANAYTFRFEDSDTEGELVALDSVTFSFFDVDANAHQGIKETISVCGADSIALAHGSALDFSKDGDCVTVAPLQLDAAPNVNGFNSLTDVQKSHAFSVSFKTTSSFSLTVFVSEGHTKTESRPLIFAGKEIAGFEAVPLSTPTPAAPAPNQKWAFVADSQGNLLAIKTTQTGTLMTEVHRMTKSSNYKEFDLHTGSALPYASDADTWSFVMAPNDDLLAIKKGPETGTSMTEVHRMSKASNYQSFNLQTGTGIHYTNNVDSFSYVMDRSSNDLTLVKKGPVTGTEMTEVHKVSASSNYQTFRLHTGTNLHYTNNADSWSFVMDANGDLLALAKGPQTGTSSTEVHRLTKASNYQTFDLQTGTPLEYTNNENSWSFVLDPTTGDLLAIKKGPVTGTDMTEVHRLTKASNYQTFDLQTGTGLECSNNE